MKPVRITIMLLFVLTTSVALAASSAQKSFDELKSLDGSWEGKSSGGQPVQIDYRVTSNGSALMSEIKGKEDMISMFNLDGGRLLMVHYCAVGNQPRMVGSSSADGKTITFDFLDATNLASPDSGHMNRLIVSIIDPNHHTEEWIYNGQGKEMKQVFDMWRKK